MPEPRPAYRVTLQTLFAADAPRAVILRRGPKSHFQMIVWETDTDRCVPGQWMRGRVYLSDLSPDGSKVLYVASQYHRARWRRERAVETGGATPVEPLFSPVAKTAKRRRRKVPRYMRDPTGGLQRTARHPPRPVDHSWTAISCPPYFTALAIWPSIGAWTGGGAFQSNKRIWLNEAAHGLTPIANAPTPPTFQVRSTIDEGVTLLGGPPPEPGTPLHQRLRARLEQGKVRRISAFDPTRQVSAETEAVAQALRAEGVMSLDWVDVRDERALLFAGDGCLWRVEEWRRRPAGRLLENATRVADFNAAVFERVAPPAAALRW